MTIRVVVVDDQALVRGGFRMILQGSDDIEVVGEAADGLEAIQVVERVRPDVVLMDIRMPGIDGIEATRRLIAAGHDARIVMLTTFDLDEYVYEGMRSGAAGFLLFLSEATVNRLLDRHPGARATVFERPAVDEVARALCEDGATTTASPWSPATCSLACLPAMTCICCPTPSTTGTRTACVAFSRPPLPPWPPVAGCSTTTPT